MLVAVSDLLSNVNSLSLYLSLSLRPLEPVDCSLLAERHKNNVQEKGCLRAMVGSSLETPSRANWSPPGSSIDVVCRLFDDIPVARQPNVEPIPVVQIQYSTDFSFVMGVYLSMHRRLALATGTGNSSPLISPVRSPSVRWLMLLGIVLTKCPSHYTAWKQRRDVVKNPALLLQSCCSESYGDQSFAIPPAELMPDEKAAVDFWTPSRSDIQCQSGLAQSSSLWRCVIWELWTTAKCFVRDFHKNFQLWHHRKELIMWAIEHTPQDALHSVESFQTYLKEHHHDAFAESGTPSASFSDVDERAVCDVVLLQEDSKNYHVWSHRSWYMSSFPFMSTPLLLEEVEATVFGNGGHHHHCTSALDFSPKPLEVLKSSGGAAEILPQPNGNTSLFLDELRFTARMISDDWFNNSAWCHRFSIFKRFIFEPLLSLKTPDSNRVERVMCALCRAEVEFALQWAVVEPCNECPFVYAKGIADLWQLSQLGLGAPSNDGTCEDHFQTKGLSWPQYSISYALHDELMRVVRSFVMPVVLEIRTATAGPITEEDRCELNGMTRSLFLRNNTHQPAAAIFRVLFDRLEATWNTFLSQDQREYYHHRCYPPTTFNAQSTNDSRCTSDHTTHEQPIEDSWSEQVRLWEVEAVRLGRELHTTDPIRAKYWRHMVHTVVHRQY